jgi:predicted ATP-binding protein involved in virulence
MIYIKSIELKNIRGFRDLAIDLTNGRNTSRKRTLILGRNGTCKSTLLRCIVIGLCDVVEGNNLVAEPMGRLIAEGKQNAKIKIELIQGWDNVKSYTNKISIKFKFNKEVVVYPKNPEKLPKEIFACGYGAGRSTEGPEYFREYRIIDSVYSLFQYEAPMIPTELSIRRLKDYLASEKYENAMKGIQKALGLTARDKIDLPKGGGVVVSGPSIGKSIPLGGWADGYRLTFSWIMDLYAHAMRADTITSEGGIRGILLVDELEQHLHPSMQTDMLLKLSKLFPEMQIIATTHSPLVALGASPEEVVVLRRKRKYVVSEHIIPDFTGYSAEDMLVDDRLFDTQVYSPATNSKLRQYQNLVKKPIVSRTPKEVEKLRILANELRSKQLPGVRESPLADELRKFRNKYDL